MSSEPPVYYMLQHTPGPAWQAGVPFREQPGVGQHVQYMGSFLATQQLVLGGPFLDDSGGAMVLRAANRETADRIAHDDPAVQAGLLQVVVRPWYVPMASIDLPPA